MLQLLNRAEDDKLLDLPAGASRQALSPNLAMVYLTCYLAIFLIHLPLILHPPTPFFYNTDEQLLTFAAIDRFLGLPSGVLQWPGSVLQLLFLPLFLMLFMASSSIGAPSAILGQFAIYLANSYEYPEKCITAMRVLSLCINSAAPILVFLLLRKLSQSRTFALFAAILFALHPLFFEFSVIALGDAVSITFALAGLAILICSEYRLKVELSGFLFAAALASKITILGVVSLPLAFLLLDGAKNGLINRFRSVLRFLGALALGFIFWNPYLWTDPVRYAKAFLGNALKPGAAFSLWIFACKFEQAMGVTFTVISCITILGAFAVQIFTGWSARVCSAFAVLGFVALPLLLSATAAEPRYLLPLLLPLIFLAAVAYGAAQRQMPKFEFPRWAIFNVLALTIASMSYEIIRLEMHLRQPDDLIAAIAFTKQFPSETVLYVPQEAFDTSMLHPSREALNRVVDESLPRLQNDALITAFLKTKHFPADAAEILVQAFNDDEQVTLRELIARSKHTGPVGWQMFVYASPLDPNLRAKRSSIAEMEQQDALYGAQGRKGTAILLDQAQPNLGKPVWQGKQMWAWYRF